MEKMAGGKEETDDQAICGIALQAIDIVKQLIVLTFRKWKHGTCRLFFACAVLNSMQVDVAMFSSAAYTLRLYVEANEYI